MAIRIAADCSSAFDSHTLQLMMLDRCCSTEDVKHNQQCRVLELACVRRHDKPRSDAELVAVPMRSSGPVNEEGMIRYSTKLCDLIHLLKLEVECDHIGSHKFGQLDPPPLGNFVT